MSPSLKKLWRLRRGSVLVTEFTGAGEGEGVVNRSRVPPWSLLFRAVFDNSVGCSSGHLVLCYDKLEEYTMSAIYSEKSRRTGHRAS